jgi:hypothetical protein
MRFVAKDLNDIPPVFKKPEVVQSMAKIAAGQRELISDAVIKRTAKPNLP